MTKGSFRKISFIPVFVMYFGFPLIRDVLPYHNDYSLQDWLALGGMYAIGLLIATPLLYLLIKTSGVISKSRLSLYGSILVASTIQMACMYLFWDSATTLYILMVLIMAMMSVIYAYASKNTYLICDKDTGNFYRIKGNKAYRIANEDIERYKANVSGQYIPMSIFSSNSISGFDHSSSVIPLSYTSSSLTHSDYNSGVTINPSTGMPMVGGISGLDIHGNSFGTNFNEPSSTYDPNRGY